MGLLTEILLVPFAPMRVALWSVEHVVEAATREHFDPAAMRRELGELSRQLGEGFIDAEEFDAREDQLLDRLEAAQQRL